VKITDKKIADWLSAKHQLDAAKAAELELRKDLCAAVSDGVDIPGTYHYQTGKGKLTATLGINFKIDEEALSQIKPKLSPDEVQCLQIKHSLILKNYKLLNPKSILNRAITTNPATPTLKFAGKSTTKEE